MSNVASDAAAFYKQVAATGTLWTLRDSVSFPAPKNQKGQRTQHFWSSRSRVELVIKNAPAYNGFGPVAISWRTFKEKWAPDLIRDNILIGINWSSSKAKGYEEAPTDVVNYIESLRDGAL